MDYLSSTFQEKDFVAYDDAGTGTVSGWAVESGAAVTLHPSTAYTLRLLDLSTALRRDCTRFDPRYAKYVRTADPDLLGVYEFTEVPPGEWIVFSATPKGAFATKILVLAEQRTEADLRPNPYAAAALRGLAAGLQGASAALQVDTAASAVPTSGTGYGHDYGANYPYRTIYPDRIGRDPATGILVPADSAIWGESASKGLQPPP